MQKIISVFQRNYDGDRLIRDEVVPGAEWVLAGEGVATRKYDGSPVLFKEGVLYKRFDAKDGKQPPDGFVPAQEPDSITGHWPGWLRIGAGPEDKWFCVAYQNFVRENGGIREGTYKAIGPHFQGNPEREPEDTLVRHGFVELGDCPRDFELIRDALWHLDIEGIVFHHPDGRMAKVKKKDFGLKRSRA